MIIFGPYELIPYVLENHPNTNVYNFTSLYEDLKKISILPPVNTMYMDEKQFDFFFQDYIFSNDSVFMNFFDSIMVPVYMGNNVYLAVDNREGSIFQMISSSLMKIIQCRYGYHCAYINDIIDIECLNPDEFFTADGIMRLDLDKERWTGILTSMMSINQIVGESHSEGYGFMDTYGI